MVNFFKQLAAGLWAATSVRTKHSGDVVVRVAYREFYEPAPERDPRDIEYGYAHVWRLEEAPTLGTRVMVGDAPGRPAVVVGFDTTYTGELLPVRRLATVSELRAADVRRERLDQKNHEDLQAWLEMARRAAGMPSSTRRRKAPADYPAIPPSSGDATGQEAGEYGRVWWRVFKAAEKAGCPADEVAQFRSIAHRWYAVRDKGGN